MEPYDAFDIVANLYFLNVPVDADTYEASSHQGLISVVECAGVICLERSHRYGSGPREMPVDGHTAEGWSDSICSILAGVALSNALPAPGDTDPAPAMMELRTVSVISLAALMAWSVERDVAGSTIKSIPDAFWWAITTVTSVGYGDKIPVSPEGKAVAVVLMFMGVALFGAIAAHACDGLHQVGYQAERCLIGPHRTARSQDRPTCRAQRE